MFEMSVHKIFKPGEGFPKGFKKIKKLAVQFISIEHLKYVIEGRTTHHRTHTYHQTLHHIFLIP
jgi:hypothetical protein